MLHSVSWLTIVTVRQIDRKQEHIGNDVKRCNHLVQSHNLLSCIQRRVPRFIMYSCRQCKQLHSAASNGIVTLKLDYTCEYFKPHLIYGYYRVTCNLSLVFRMAIQHCHDVLNKLVTFQSVFDLLFCRLWIATQQSEHWHNHTRTAEATLYSMTRHQSLLQSFISLSCHPFFVLSYLSLLCSLPTSCTYPCGQ